MIVRRRGARLAFNIVALNGVWLVTILGAARSLDLLGPVAAVLHVVLHCALISDRPRRDVAIVAASLPIGFAVDTLLVVGGAMAFPLGPISLGPWPLWMAALWINFATALRLTLAFLVVRPLLFAAVGAVGGPFAYLMGAQLGALEVSMQPAHLGLLAGLWGAASWALALLARRLLNEAKGEDS